MAMNIETFYEIIGRLLSRQRIRELGWFLQSAGVSVIPEAFAGFMTVSCILLSILGFIIAIQIQPIIHFFTRLSLFLSKSFTAQYSLFGLPLLTLLLLLIFSFLAISISLILLVYVILLLRADARRRAVEAILPDFLVLAAANTRAGMPIDQALWYAAKPEFGLFSREVELVAKRAFGGEPFGTALDRLAIRFDSRLLRRTVALVKQGLASGGEIAEILERTAEDARAMQIVNKDISASLIMYVIFIIFAATIGTPFLFSVVHKLITMLTGFFAQLPPLENLPSTGFIRPTPPSITRDDFFLFTIGTTLLTAIFACLIIGIIQTGSKRNGVKYIPFLLAASLLVYFTASTVLDIFFPSPPAGV